MPHNQAYLTNNHSFLSKYSAIKNGLFDDKLLELFVEQGLNISSGWSRTSQVNLGYAARLHAVEYKLNQLIKTDNIDYVIVLGAGYDTLAFRHLGNNISNWLEIDLPEVVEKKIKFIEEFQVLDLKIIEKEDHWAYYFNNDTLNYHIISADLRDSLMIQEHLSRSLQITKPKNVLILNEVCLCYLEQIEIESIFINLIKILKDNNTVFKINYLGYEQLKPDKSITMPQIMNEHFDAIGQSLNYFPSKKDIKKLFKEDLNFNQVAICPMYQMFYNTIVPELTEDRQIWKSFDEYEEFDLYLSHYAIVESVMLLIDPFNVGQFINRNHKEEEEQEVYNEVERGFSEQDVKQTVRLVDSKFRRYGHSSCILDDNLVLISGGFGKNPKQSGIHRRMKECQLFHTEADRYSKHRPDSEINCDKFPSKELALDRMHGQVKLIKDNCEGFTIFFNGGRQNPMQHNRTLRPFIATMDDEYNLTLKHVFDYDESSIYWRHKMSDFDDGKIYQVGGLGLKSDRTSDELPLIVWDFSSSKLGSSVCRNSRLSYRTSLHSVAMDFTQNNNVLLVLGGINQTRYLISEQPRASLIDLREPDLTNVLDICNHCYDCNIHFINDHQFVKIGGVSATNGQEEAWIELIDLRNSKIIDRIHCEDSDGLILIGNTTCHFKDRNTIQTIGGGGNFFTFGSRFNKSSILYTYRDIN